MGRKAITQDQLSVGPRAMAAAPSERVGREIEVHHQEREVFAGSERVEVWVAPQQFGDDRLVFDRVPDHGHGADRHPLVAARLRGTLRRVGGCAGQGEGTGQVMKVVGAFRGFRSSSPPSATQQQPPDAIRPLARPCRGTHRRPQIRIGNGNSIEFPSGAPRTPRWPSGRNRTASAYRSLSISAVLRIARLSPHWARMRTSRGLSCARAFNVSAASLIMGRAMERFPLSFSSCESPTSSVASWLRKSTSRGCSRTWTLANAISCSNRRRASPVRPEKNRCSLAKAATPSRVRELERSPGWSRVDCLANSWACSEARTAPSG